MIIGTTAHKYNPLQRLYVRSRAGTFIVLHGCNFINHKLRDQKMGRLLSALEEIDLEPNESEVLSSQIEASQVYEFVEDDSGLFDLAGSSLDSLRRVSAVSDMLVNQNNHSGIGDGTAQALQLAVESICRIEQIEYRPVTFKSQTSFAAKRENCKIAIESFSSAASSIYNKLKELIAKIISWFKKLFESKRIKNKLIQRKIDLAEDKIKERRNSTDMPDPQSYFTNQELVKKLHIGGSVPQGINLIRASNDHFKQMNDFYRTGIKYCSTLNDFMLKCLGAINKDGDEFNNLLGEVYSGMLSKSIIDTPAKKADRAYSRGVLLYEEPLVFGDISYFKTAANSVVEINSTDVVARVGQSTTVHSPDLQQKLYVLEEIHYTALRSNIASHASNSVEWLDKFEELIDKADKIRIELDRIDRNKQLSDRDTSRSARRARQLMRAFNMYTVQYNSFSNGVYSYDQVICSALLDYVLASTK